VGLGKKADMPTMSAGIGRQSAVLASLGLFAVWTLSTWFLDGRIETLLRPEATADCAFYGIAANILICTALAIKMRRIATYCFPPSSKQ